MSMYVNPLMYLNLGGEMLYVIQHRLAAQKIEERKTIQVLDDITASFLNPKILATVFQKAPLINLTSLRTTLEAISLSSIMKLGQSSMNKLFDLMMMMFKYQLIACTGPREVILVTLNHIDALRDMVTQTSAHECITLVHRMIVDVYGELTHDEIWQARNECLIALATINVRVSVLLRLGLQNDDTTFNILPQNYDEKFEERRSEVGTVKLLEGNQKGYNLGSFKLFGHRVTLLGKNIYSPNYIKAVRCKPLKNRDKCLKDRGTRAELGMLAKQLGTEETSSVPRPFSLDLFDDSGVIEIDDNRNDESEEAGKTGETLGKLDADHKAKLDNISADLEGEEGIDKKMNLLQLLDEVE
ncbi:protein OSCP1-like [Diachasmimorpha longicaudata]|uniref:protein OSCP1-like n=1 Tax=Diachasmimorpha longicaudata TaxID=58733 RepID=UPI0030B89273